MPIPIVLAFTVRYDGFTVEIEERFSAVAAALIGPSGAGKTTILEAIAGLRRPASGEIGIAGRVLFSSSQAVDLPARRRHVGYVPQDLALFPHMSVRRNILYGAARGGTVTLDRIAGILEIGALMARGVAQLSGGERQRVALARALMSAPDLLLLDEPLAALDMPLRRRIIPYLHRIRDELRVPMIYVSHDREEVGMVADRVIEIAGGRVVQSGPSAEIL